jgi:hypothetical protein
MNAIEIINNVEVLNQDQYEIVVAYDKENGTDLVYTYLNDISYPSGLNRWLNINVYSEADKEEHDLRKEIGY